MDKAELIRRIKNLLNIEEEPKFLEKLSVKELETLIAYIRDRVDNPTNSR